MKVFIFMRLPVSLSIFTVSASLTRFPLFFNSDMAKIRMMTPCLFYFILWRNQRRRRRRFCPASLCVLKPTFFLRIFVHQIRSRLKCALMRFPFPKKRAFVCKKWNIFLAIKLRQSPPQKDILTIFSLALSEEKLSL